jgi:DNA-binding MurR/RpiR family transcriptional regulator
MNEMSEASVIERLRRELPELSGRESRAARYLMANYPMAGLTTVAEFAEQSGVSTATILRLVKRLGFPIYADFQASLRRHLEETLQSPLLHFGERKYQERSARHSFFDRFMETMALHLHNLRDRIPASEFERVTALLSDSRRDVHVLGGRYSSNVTTYLGDLLTAVRGRVFTIHGQTQTWPQHLLDMGKGSVLLVFDVRRYQQDVVEFAHAASRRGATVVLMTDNWQSPAARAADHVLSFPVESPSVFDVLTIGLALGEALVGAVANRMGNTAKARIEMLEELRTPFAPREETESISKTAEKRRTR